jgi:hypothetical protein
MDDNEGDVRDETSVVFGFHASAGLETSMGPGFLALELRAGTSFGDPGVLDDADVSGFSLTLGYRFVL